MTPSQVLEKIFTEISYRDAMLGIPFKPRAYELAAESITAHGDDIEVIWKNNGIAGLKQLPGIGQHIAEKIDEYFRTGKIREYVIMKDAFPVDIWELSRIEGLGPKHINDLYLTLRIKNLEDLKRAIAKHRIAKLPHWGPRSEQKLQQHIELHEKESGRRLLGDALPIAEAIAAQLKKIPGVTRCVIAGSIRRRQETIGDIDLIATATHPTRVMDAFTTLPDVETVLEKGKTRSSVRLRIGIDADLRVVPDEVFGATLQYFTGDKRHNVLLREYAMSKGLTLNEYGLFRHSRNDIEHKNDTRIACQTEDGIYHHLGMQTPPPEIRIGADEIDAARNNTLPDLLPYGSIKGDLQIQTNWSDGNATIQEMAQAARAAKLTYIAITDHSKSLAFINGLDEKRLAKQRKEIDALNAKKIGIDILAGTECDIRKDGTLDLSDAALAQLDWVGVSIHSNFTLSRSEQTHRIIKAISHPSVDCLFHPTCRLIGKREPIMFDFDEVVAAAKQHRVALEINSAPERSDLRDIMVRAAVRAGVMLVINSDAHAPDHLNNLPLGEAIARRGWATAADILNTKTSTQLRAYLAKKKRTAK